MEYHEENSVDEGKNDALSSPRKRGSSFESPADNSQRKKQKADNNADKAVSQNIQYDPDKEKENNGRSSVSRRRKTNELSNNLGDFLPDRNINPANKAPEAGIITKIYAENFMCHKRLTVKLNANVNFIFGQNGSGKSAILAALQICLGAGARRTNRARNLKDLVRKDTSHAYAKVRVTLLNKGDDAYDHKTYGDYITVERTISLHSGAYNGYKLYDENDKEISKSKKVLLEILDKLNIQVENPVAILDQEDAKKFLTGKAEAKYAFFMKATELERLDNKFASTMEEVLQMKTQAARLEKSLYHDEELVAELKKAYKKHAAIGKLEGKKSQLEVEYAWASYKVSCDEHRFHLERFEKFKERAEKKREELTQAEAASQEADDPNDERRTRLEALSNEADQMAVRKMDLEKQLKEVTEPHKSLKRQLRLLIKEEEKANRGLLEANQRLQAKRDEIVAKAGSAESDQGRRNQRLQAAERQVSEKKSRHNELKQAITDALNAYENVEAEVDGARQMVSQLEHQLRGINGKIRSMENSSDNSLDIFGPNCAKVKRMVERATQQGKFRDPVLGPIGLYCKIQPGKDEFASLAELAIGGGMLDRFVVFNAYDRKLFQKIRQDAGCRSDCGILQQHKHPRFTVPEAPQGVETVATVLSIENDLVFNCLVDQAKIDTKALAHSKEDSERLLLVKDKNNRYSVRGGKINETFFLPRGDNWKLNRGQLQMISNTRRPKKTIGVDMRAAIEDAKNEHKSISEDLREKNRTYNRLEYEHTNHKKQWNQKKRELQENQLAIDRAMKEIEDVKAEEAAIVDNDVDTGEEEEEVSLAQSHLEEIKESQRKAEEEIQQKLPQIEMIRGEVDEITARNEKVLRDIRKAEHSLSQHYQEMAHQQDKIEKKRQKLKQYEDLVSQHTDVVKTAEEDARSYMNMARKIQYMCELAALRRSQREEAQNEGRLVEWQSSECNQDPTDEDLEKMDIPDYVDALKNCEYYKTRIEQTETKIEREKQRRLENGDDEATSFAKYMRAKEVFCGKEKQLNIINKEAKKLDGDIELRQKRWEQYRDYITDFTDVKFDEVLNKKGSSGRLEFDHDKKMLNLVVCKDMHDEQSQQKDVKALSGGERSFATIALLLALGESLETPFRVMDEFDVFLDPKARTLVIDQLVHVAKEMSHRQFIFITPQDVSHLDESTDNLKIVHMKPPQRRTEAGGLEQQTLGFSPQEQ
mmetsp:Transcript_18798/g.52504  ORF Transcript_18798/g.52504 Transcript_18798/m.52504 type:complete len:1214 (+) Transcript_18798:218-3859(+)|eukprot:CAMPEP_0172370364 /NCGR_PEP_ID=MMETSP1060-20121228/37299_1 /TAXON_ID=37318 /ORGANISM="Pseudo-nitzschia pungens, Strain cf. cingulata" /LENGTH=1213 /DNA_ID=CAMNT_0013095601 /DNA_START=98 /DNA_END=3739 /DNA_ORIENTATION=-